MNYFDELSKIDCSNHVEKKGKFSYLSWPFAVAELKKKHPSATWEVKKSESGAPYTQTPAGCFVEVEVDVDGVKLSQIHPVLDNRNQTIKEPNAFQVNTSIQRCLVKAIALHGLGLYIYAGEDLPLDDDAELLSNINNCKSLEDLTELHKSLSKQEQQKYQTFFTSKKNSLG